MKKGKIVQISGPVVDVEFEDSELPFIRDALEVDNHGKRCVMEVAQHIGNHVVRCIFFSIRRGIAKGYGGYSIFTREESVPVRGMICGVR